MSIGYTTSENKLNQLKQGGKFVIFVILIVSNLDFICAEFERFQFKNNERVLDFEENQRFMNLVLITMFFAKSRGGTKVDKSFMEVLESKCESNDATLAR